MRRLPFARCHLLGPLALAVGAIACGSSSPPAGSDDVDISPISIDSVDVSVTASTPPTVSARVKGVVGDGCSEALPASQFRDAGTVTLVILRSRPRAAICTQIARLYDETIPLAGAFPAGRYLLRVNNVEKTFTTP
jgi:hypothetical protein